MGSGRKRKRQSNGDAQATSSKRRRSSNAHQNRPNSRNDSSKGGKKPPADPVDPSNPSTSTDKEKRKHRPRCHKMCSDAVDKITKALRSSPNPIGHLFKSADDDAMPYALLSDIIPILSLPPRLLTLPAEKLPLLNANEHVFQMSCSDTGQFIVKYAPIDFSIEDATVYLDRLPYPCSHRLLEKLCTKFGTAVDIRIPIRTPAPLRTSRTVLQRKGTQHKGFAFVQFACREEAEAICKEFALNHPIVQQNKTRWFFNRGKRVHMGQHPTKFAALTALRQARALRVKRRLEKELCRKLKLRQWRKEWKERRRRIFRERRKKKRKRDKLRKAGKLVEKKPQPETPKKSKKEKRKEANKKRRKRLNDLKKEAKQLLAMKTGQPVQSDSESAMDTSGEEERKEGANGQPSDPVPGPGPEAEPNSANGKKGEGRGDRRRRKKGEEKMEKVVEQPLEEIKKKRKRRCKRKEIRKSVRSHFIDTQAVPFREYVRMREEYLRLRKEAEERDGEELSGFTAKNSNHKREEYREAKWSLEEADEE